MEKVLAVNKKLGDVFTTYMNPFLENGYEFEIFYQKIEDGKINSYIYGKAKLIEYISLGIWKCEVIEIY